MLKNLILITSSLLFSTTISANNPVKNTEKKPMPIKELHATAAKYKKIQAEYEDYLKTVPAEVRQEIVSFRKNIVRLNMRKAKLYKELSQEAQKYLKYEQSVKRKLPLDARQIIQDSEKEKEFIKNIKNTETSSTPLNSDKEEATQTAPAPVPAPTQPAASIN